MAVATEAVSTQAVCPSDIRIRLKSSSILYIACLLTCLFACFVGVVVVVVVVVAVVGILRSNTLCVSQRRVSARHL